MGYYQFDNRYDLQTFLSYCYGKDNAKYAMFAPYLNMNKKDLANNKGLDNAWKQAYKNDPNDFAIKQDEFEYNNYYVPVENNLKLNQQWMIKLLYQKFMITYTLST